MTQISTCVGMFQRKCCSTSQLRCQHPVSGVIPWSTTADTDTYFNVFGTASQLADRVFVQLKTVVNCVQWSTKSLSGNRDFWEEFLSLCQLHPCLWNSKCKEYSNKHVREHAYKELVTKCKEQFPTADEEFGVKKIHAFRFSFRRELKKVIESQKSGTSADDVYVPTLWYYYLLSFNADSEIPRRGNMDLVDVTDDGHKPEMGKRQTSMTPAVFEPAIPASKRPQTFVLDRSATGIGLWIE